LKYKVLFMEQEQQGLEALKDIRNMMERSSRFISLSGWSGIFAGIWALMGSALGYVRIRAYPKDFDHQTEYGKGGLSIDLEFALIYIALGVLLAALVSAIRKLSPQLVHDRPLDRDIAAVAQAIAGGAVFHLPT